MAGRIFSPHQLRGRCIEFSQIGEDFLATQWNRIVIFLPCGKAGGLQIPRCQGFAVVHYSFTLFALALKPSGFCNDRVYAYIFLTITDRLAIGFRGEKNSRAEL